MKNIMSNILMILLTIILLVSTLLIGSPLTENIRFLNIFIHIAGIIFFSYKIIKKEKIIKNKIDIFIIIIVISSIIPLIFNKAVNLEGTINYILRYFSILVIYFISKEITKDNPKYLEYIINILIVSGVIITIFGIDLLSSRYSLDLLNKLNNYIKLERYRFTSTFGYANSLSCFLGMLIILGIGQYLKKENIWIKSIYMSIITVFLNFIIEAHSRAIWIILAFLICIYIILIKEKNKKIELIINISISLIIGVICSYIFETNLIRGLSNKNWILIIITMIITYFINVIYNYIYKICNINNLLLVAIATIGCLILFIIIGLNIITPLKLFENKYAREDYEQTINEIDGNKRYKFDFDIIAKSKANIKDEYKIEIIQKDKQGKEIKKDEIIACNYEGIKGIEIQTKEDISSLVIKYSRKNGNVAQGLIIKELKINEKRVPVNYLYIPRNVVESASDINVSTKSVWERGIFIKDGMKIAKGSNFIGIGGDGWKYAYKEVQEYDYYTTEVHSYPIEILLEFGIIGFIGLAGITIETIIKIMKFIKNKENDIEILSMIIALLLIMSHCVIDFDMSFMHIMIVTYMLIGIISERIK